MESSINEEANPSKVLDDSLIAFEKNIIAKVTQDSEKDKNKWKEIFNRYDKTTKPKTEEKEVFDYDD